eukprot:NODE_21_length_38511_cov_0.503306.p2 type:complete len:1658 gc:universal NODE_21_length_38511_cov_0.503306:13233-8260(-)
MLKIKGESARHMNFLNSDSLKKYGPNSILMLHLLSPFVSKYAFLVLNLVHIISITLLKQFRKVYIWISFFIFLLGFIISFYDNFTGQIVMGISLFKLFALLEYSGLQHILNTSFPLLVEVLLLLSFFYLLFAVIGVSIFQSSLDRYCFVKSDLFPDLIRTNQHCGSDGKGYQCPNGQVCKIGNRSDGFSLLSYDNIFNSFLTTFVVSSLEDWTPIMYWTMLSEYYVSSIFYIIIVIFISFTLLKLFVAVITETYNNIRTRERALKRQISNHEQNNNKIYEFYHSKEYQAILAATVATEIVIRIAYSEINSHTQQWLYPIAMEITFCIAYIFDSILLLASSSFNNHKKLLSVGFNLFLSIGNIIGISTVLWAPDRRPYYLVFNLLRTPKILFLTPRIQGLADLVLKSYAQLVSLFLLSVSYIFIGGIILNFFFSSYEFDIEDVNYIFDFSTVLGSMTGVFQLFIGDGWDNVTLNSMYLINRTGITLNVVLFGTFCVCFYIFAKLIITNLLVAVILENFSLSEPEKKLRQLRAFFKDFKKRNDESDFENIMSSTVKNEKRKKNHSSNSDSTRNTKFGFLSTYLPNNFSVPGVRKETIQKYLNQEFLQMQNEDPNNDKDQLEFEKEPPWFFVKIHNPFKIIFKRKREQKNRKILPKTNRNDMSCFGMSQKSFLGKFLLHIVSAVKIAISERNQLGEVDDEDGNNDLSFFCLGNDNPIRRFCLYIYDPQKANNYFEYFIRLTIFSSMIESAYDTPINRFDTLDESNPWPIYRIFDLVTVLIFSSEFLVKVISSGFILNKKSYLRNLWNRLDFVILTFQIIGLSLNTKDNTGIARVLRATKALRVLRIVNQFKGIRDIFRFFILAFSRLLDALMLSLIVFIPFALYGNYVYKDLFKSCNDGSVRTKSECVGIFEVTSQLGINILVPRVWKNLYAPYYTFDSFSKSLLTTFVLSTSESWTDIFNMANMSKKYDDQPVPTRDIDPFSILYFFSFMIIGSLIVVNLFAGIIIQNFLNISGLAYLTVEQRQYIDVMKQIKLVKATVQSARPISRFRAWCYDKFNSRRYSKFINFSLLSTVVVLLIQFQNETVAWAQARDAILSFFILVFLGEVIIKYNSLGYNVWNKSPGNIFDLVVVSGALLSITLEYSFELADRPSADLNKAKRVFMLSLTFKLVQHIPILVQLFKIIYASISQIRNILGVFAILLLTYSLIFMEIFGLTRYYQIYNSDANFRTLPNSMLLLLRMITGEIWHRVMNDCLIDKRYCVEFDSNYLFSDCGSRSWGFLLFMSYYVICTYVFLNMFTVIVLENFNYFSSEDVKKSVVSTSDLNLFKIAWAKFDENGTGYIREKQLIPFLHVIEGKLSVKLYPTGLDVPTIKKSVQVIVGTEKSFNREIVLQLNKNFENIFDGIPSQEFQSRRLRLNRVYIECMMNMGSKGIALNVVLLVLTKTVLGNKSYLRIDDYIKRKMEMEEIDKIMYLEKSTGILATIIQRKRFLKYINNRVVLEPKVPDLAAVGDPSTAEYVISSNSLYQSAANGLDTHILSNILKSRRNSIIMHADMNDNELNSNKENAIPTFNGVVFAEDEALFANKRKSKVNSGADMQNEDLHSSRRNSLNANNFEDNLVIRRLSNSGISTEINNASSSRKEIVSEQRSSDNINDQGQKS